MHKGVKELLLHTHTPHGCGLRMSNYFQNLENQQNLKISSTALSLSTFSEMLIKTCSYLFVILSRLRNQLPGEGNAWTIWFMHLQHIRSQVIIRIADSGIPWLSSITSFSAVFFVLLSEQVRILPGKSPQLSLHIWKKRQNKKYLVEGVSHLEEMFKGVLSKAGLNLLLPQMIKANACIC